MSRAELTLFDCVRPRSLGYFVPMNTKNIALAAGLAASMIAHAQQNPQPQPQAPQMKESPCPPCLPKPPKGIHFHLPKAIQGQVNKELASVTKTTGVELTPPSPADLAKQVQKPCIAPAVTTPPQIQPKQ